MLLSSQMKLPKTLMEGIAEVIVQEKAIIAVTIAVKLVIQQGLVHSARVIWKSSEEFTRYFSSIERRSYASLNFLYE